MDKTVCYHLELILKTCDGLCYILTFPATKKHTVRLFVEHLAHFGSWGGRFVTHIAVLKMVSCLFLTKTHNDIWLCLSSLPWLQCMTNVGFILTPYENRRYNNWFLNLDGKDCTIQDPSSFSTHLYINNFHGPGIRYQIILSVFEYHIDWENGPYTFGIYPGEMIFNIGLTNMLLSFECVLCDRWYTGIIVFNLLTLTQIYVKIYSQGMRRWTNVWRIGCIFAPIETKCILMY